MLKGNMLLTNPMNIVPFSINKSNRRGKLHAFDRLSLLRVPHCDSNRGEAVEMKHLREKQKKTVDRPTGRRVPVAVGKTGENKIIDGDEKSGVPIPRTVKPTDTDTRANKARHEYRIKSGQK